MAPDPIELAEDFMLHLPPRPGFLRLVRDDFVLTTGTSGAAVTRIRLAADAVEAAVAETRLLVDGEDVDRITWWCGTRATPADLPDRLAALGLAPDPEAETLAILVLETEPAGTPGGEVRRIETLDDYRIAQELDWDACAVDHEVRERRRARLEEIWESSLEQGAVHYLGCLDGEPVGFARAFYLDGGALLLGGSVLPRARGRGVYQALVHARWRDAAALGAPRLVVQAGPMSRPILERLGFRRLGEIQLYVDRL